MTVDDVTEPGTTSVVVYGWVRFYEPNPKLYAATRRGRNAIDWINAHPRPRRRIRAGVPEGVWTGTNG